MDILALWLGKPISFFPQEDPDEARQLLEVYGIKSRFLGYTADGSSGITVSGKDYDQAVQLINEYFSSRKRRNPYAAV